MNGKIDIEFTCYRYEADDGLCTLFLFYPGGEWDESKRGLNESLTAYPPERYEWVHVDQEN